MKPANNAPVYCAIYPGLAEIARSFGYALTIHGSMGRDFDIVAVPWAEVVGTPVEVIEAICYKYAVTLTPGDPAVMNHGRICYNLALMGEFYFDLSFIQFGRAASKLREGLNQAIEILATIVVDPSQLNEEEIHDLRTLERESRNI